MPTKHRSIRKRRGTNTRSTHLVVRFSPEEKEEAQSRATAIGYPLAAYIREMALGHGATVVRHTVKAETIRTLAQAGNVLKEMTHTAALTGSPLVESEARAVIASIMDAIIQINRERK